MKTILDKLLDGGLDTDLDNHFEDIGVDGYFDDSLSSIKDDYLDDILNKAARRPEDRD